MKVAISISYCQSHAKGGNPPDCSFIPGHLHARMLSRTVDYLRNQSLTFSADDRFSVQQIIICATAFPGITHIHTSPDAPEREYLWDVFRKTRFVTMADNPGHQGGAQWAIRMGIEAASKLGCDFLIHTAEDILPYPGALKEMLRKLIEEEADYVGELWGVNKDELNAQFFGCRLSWFASAFDGGGMNGRWTEKYMADLVRGHGRKVATVERLYYHTHDPEQHERMVVSADSFVP